MLLPVRIKEDKTMKKMDLTISKKGFPCLWERGLVLTNLGDRRYPQIRLFLGIGG